MNDSFEPLPTSPPVREHETTAPLPSASAATNAPHYVALNDVTSVVCVRLSDWTSQCKEMLISGSDAG